MRLLIASTHFSRSRDFLLVRHSLTPGADYSELHDALHRLGVVVDLPFESLFVVQSFFGPGSVCGDVQTPLLQTVPFGQAASSEHVCAQPLCVHTEPGLQLD